MGVQISRMMTPIGLRGNELSSQHKGKVERIGPNIEQGGVGANPLHNSQGSQRAGVTIGQSGPLPRGNHQTGALLGEGQVSIDNRVWTPSYTLMRSGSQTTVYQPLGLNAATGRGDGPGGDGGGGADDRTARQE